MSNTIKLISLATLIALTGCGSKNYAQESSPVVYQNAAPYTTGISPAPMPVPQTQRIITKRAFIELEVDNIEKAKSELVSLIEKNSGHIINSNLSENNYHASVKVPPTHLVKTLEEISNLGDKISQSMSQNDVTAQFVDNEARIKNLILFREKMKALLNKTSNIEEILTIEKELRRVQTEIDSITGRQKYLKDAVALTPINVDFKEKTVYGPLGYLANGIWWVTKKLFIIK